jgi:hypothetical protein
VKLLDHLLSTPALDSGEDGIKDFSPNVVTCVTSITDQPAEPSMSGPHCPGPDVCAGCYSVGIMDGRERFIHPPKPSPDWKAWLKRWEPKGRIQ